MKNYLYSGAGALVSLHEKGMSKFLITWKIAENKNLKLPDTDDADYISLETLLLHVLNSSGGYLKWICQKLELPDPKIEKPPEVKSIRNEAEKYLEYLFEKWKTPLTEVPKEKFFAKTYKSNWGVEYCIEAMLEHAVMHPIRHESQLNNLMKIQNTT